MGLIKVGKRAPDFELLDADGNTVRLSNYAGRRVVLYFYPKDMTPGCTQEAQDFTRWADAFRKAGVDVLGVSPDSPAQHRRFVDARKLRVRLLSDPEHRVAEAYGVWQEKNLYGQKRWGIVRTTFLIGEDGRVEKVWERVRVDQHAREVLACVRGEKGWKPKKKTAKKKTAKKKTAKKKTAKKKT
ncbi:MAG: thioredoxin-dependent thiol peroxidase, partial [Planctomycetota bacterium]